MGWRDTANSNLAARHRRSQVFRNVCRFVTWFGVFTLGVLLLTLAIESLPVITTRLWTFLTSMPSVSANKAGIKAGIVGSLFLITMTAIIAIPIGVATAVYLEEYSRKGVLASFLEINISNLAGVPSIVYGILGLTVFVRFFHFGESILSGAFALALLILPVIITASREAIKAVPSSLRQAAYGLGATRWQVVWHHVLPSALPGILTGVILSLSRAIGESAPLLVVGAAATVFYLPEDILDQYTAMPIQVYTWAGDPKAEFHELASAGIVVLLAVLLVMNAIAVVIRWKSESKLS